MDGIDAQNLLRESRPSIDYDEVYSEYFGRIVVYLSRTVGSDDAEDLAQEVFCKAFNAFKTFDQRSSVYTWIYRIATNHLIDTVRGKRKTIDRCKLSDKELFCHVQADFQTPELQLVQTEMKECICSYIKQLPAKYMAVIILKEYESMCMAEKSIPVLSCEGACIRGEIARLAANSLSKQSGFKRGCHGELFTVPGSKIAEWIKTADSVICIEGCFLRCHSRIMENIIEPSKLRVFDALSHYNRFNDIFDIDDVPEAERKAVAESVFRWVLTSMQTDSVPEVKSSCS